MGESRIRPEEIPARHHGVMGQDHSDTARLTHVAADLHALGEHEHYRRALGEH